MHINILIQKHEGKRPFGRPGRRCDYNVRVVVREIRWESVKWIHLAQDRNLMGTLVNTVINLQVA
jgi:hypothetical protein